MRIDLESTLAELKGQHNMDVEFDSSDGTFYRTTGGQRRQVTFDSPGLSEYCQIEEYVHSLPPEEQRLRGLIINQVQEAVCLGLVDEGMIIMEDDNIRPTRTATCHVIWQRMKETLKEKYNIDWASPQDKNPETFYD